MIKLVEDRMNLDHDTKEADVQVIILVEDSIRFYSSYLPMMYTCLIQQNRSAILEALNNWGKTLRMRGRPKIVLARTFEEAIGLYTTYRHNILGVITDMSYLKSGEQDKYAGLELTQLVLKQDPEIPILIQSSDANSRDMAEDSGANFIWKNSSSLLFELNRFMTSHYGFGPFIFRDPKTMEEIARAETMRDLQRLLPPFPRRVSTTTVAAMSSPAGSGPRASIPWRQESRIYRYPGTEVQRRCSRNSSKSSGPIGAREPKASSPSSAGTTTTRPSFSAGSEEVLLEVKAEVLPS